MSYSIEEIEGIGKEYGEALRGVDIQTTEDLLRRCGDKNGREGVATEAGLSAKLLLEWANHADLMRINGVGGEYADLLEAAGVDTVKEFATRNAENLAEKMDEVNNERKRTDRVPNAPTLQKWIDEAAGLDPMISH